MAFTTPLLWRYYATSVAFLCHYCDVTLAVQETELEAADAARAAAHNAQLEAEAAVDDVHATLAIGFVDSRQERTKRGDEVLHGRATAGL